MKKLLVWSILLVSAVGLSGCAPKTQLIDKTDKIGPTLSLDAEDFTTAAAEAVQKMIASGAVAKPGGGRFVLAISRVINDTQQRFDTDLLVKKIRVELLNSGKVVVSTAVSANGAEDNMSMQARQLRSSDEFDQSTVQKKGTLVAPDLSLSGKIIQRNTSLSKTEQRVDYYFQLSVTELKTGLAFFESETPISKRGSAKSVTW
ncbi:MAG: penicillin-binding protein activator LpoB [Alphaproteobacteria bacterium]|nr:penicillin-binding protein activator LpoB [Alphaproteobacteria bacterium]